MVPNARVGSIEVPSSVWNWILAKQGLAEGRSAASVEAAADGALGLHAARVGSPFATAVARTGPDVPLTELLGNSGSQTLVTIRCMRKTLHTLPVSLAGAAHGATLGYRLRDLASLARRMGFTLDELEPDIARILQYLQVSGRQSHRAIELAFDPTDVYKLRLALKLAWERGDITYRNCANSWHREHRTFELRSRSHPLFDTRMGEEVATGRLVAAYFRRYGPATLKDASWWSGLGQARIAAELARLDVVQLRLPWSPGPFYMLQDEYTRFHLEGAKAETGVQLLAHEDVALKAYFDSRSRYLGTIPASFAFNSIGEVRSTVLHDGRVVGLWRWDPLASRVRVRHYPGAVDAVGRRQSLAKAAGFEARLAAGYHPERASVTASRPT